MHNTRRNVEVSLLKRVRAFTLVELLVVIGIIAVLISILLPALSKARQAAGTVACGAQMRQLGMAWIEYYTDNKGWLLASMKPFSSNGGYGGSLYDNTNGETRQYGFWYNSLVDDFLQTYKVVNCPVRDPNEADWPLANFLSGPPSKMAALNETNPADGVLRGHCEAGGGFWSCNYSYPQATFGAGQSPSPSGTSYPANWGPRKMLGGKNSLDLLSKSAAATGTGTFGSLTMDNIMVITDGSDVLNGPGVISGGDLFLPRRWSIHDRAGQHMNALFIDGHVAVVQKSGATALQGNGNIWVCYALN